MHPFSFNNVLLTEILQAKTTPLPMKKMYFSSKILFFWAGGREKNLAACENTLVKPAACAAGKYCSPEGSAHPAAWEAKRTPTPFILRHYSTAGKRAGTRPIQPDSELALPSPTHRKGHCSYLCEGYRIMLNILRSKDGRTRDFGRSLRRGAGLQSTASFAEKYSTVERT